MTFDVSVESTVTTFVDMPQNHWAVFRIYALADIGIIRGFSRSDGRYDFRPDNTITRAEFMTIITRAFNIHNEYMMYYGLLSDVTPNEWYYSFVVSAINAGIANPEGMGDGTFGANLPLSREQMVTFTARALNVLWDVQFLDASAEAEMLGKFTDQDTINDFARAGVALCVYLGVLHGFEDGTFRPRQNMTRAEVASVKHGIFVR